MAAYVSRKMLEAQLNQFNKFKLPILSTLWHFSSFLLHVSNNMDDVKQMILHRERFSTILNYLNV